MRHGHNHSRVGSVAGGLASDSFEEFDSLPRELRDFLNEAPFVQASSEVVNALRSGMTTREIVDALRFGMAKKISIDNVEVWNEPSRRIDMRPIRPVRRRRVVGVRSHRGLR